MDVRGTGGDFVEIERDTDILTTLLTVIGRPRHSKAPFKPAYLTPDGRPDEQFELAQPPRGRQLTPGGLFAPCNFGGPPATAALRA